MRILVVEDDPDLRFAVVSALRSAGMAVDEAGHWVQADLELSVNEYDCMVLDRMLPDGDTVTHLRQRREQGCAVPALFLTALDELADRVAGFEAGADDYLPKPFAIEELVVRVRALCRRNARTMPAVQRVGGLSVDTARREARRDGVLLTLTPKEFGVLEALVTRHPAAVSRSALREHCWDEFTDPNSNVVDVVIAQLRRKLGDPPVIETVRGVGYRVAAR
ncbi:response regulator transcription factor [Catenuloplanes indicus]|uniref:DNA-binding response OmpR family regulator n=1 Tax=Catenuloplanes indicus TaxID=137267 RepID=A0AAE3W5N8_9ACTN|nr:response regulator transcription factor [Catenuloplanes indicus]MDQ0369939.1 DNA-binding response OmpR family regulator [Catenuloplanes indicus]